MLLKLLSCSITISWFLDIDKIAKKVTTIYSLLNDSNKSLKFILFLLFNIFVISEHLLWTLYSLFVIFVLSFTYISAMTTENTNVVLEDDSQIENELVLK